MSQLDEKEGDVTAVKMKPSNSYENFRYAGVRTLAVMVTTVAGLTPVQSVLAAPVLEEIIVTAQKREESLQDVPIAITAFTGDQLRNGNISRYEDLAVSVPNFSFTEAVSGSDQFYVRGVGSGINFGFEQAVGQVVDGFFFGRSRFGRASFLDADSIEILKGPQGALIGKNTTAGAINIRTAQPTDEFEAWITPSIEVEGNEGYSIQGAISGPLTETLSARLAVRYDDKDGYVDNEVTGDENQSLDDLSYRVKLLWRPSEDLDVGLTYQRADYERRGRTRQMSDCGDNLKNFAGGFFFNQLTAVGDDCKANDSRAVDNLRKGESTPEVFDLEIDFAGLTINWDVGEHRITSLTGYTEYEAIDEFDLDATIIEFGGASIEDNFEQFSQEIRIASPIGDSFDYIAGAYYASTETVVPFTRHFALLPPPLSPSSNYIETDQDSETIALFGQVTWHFSEQWDTTLGLRYTDETKDVTQIQFPTALYTSGPPINLIPPAGPSAASHQLKESRGESNLSPSINLQWRPNDNAMYYASVRRGFKGGGFDFQNDGNQDVAAAKFEYEDEEVTAYELGAKLILADGAAQLNLALFRSEFDDLQVSTIDDASATFNVGNAASVITQGLEADLTWALTDEFRLFATVAFLDSEYDDYPEGPCNFPQNPTGGPCVQDLGGKELPYSPDFAGTISGEYVWPLGESLELTTFVQVAYTDEFATVLDLDPNTYQDSNTKVDARITLADTAHRWEVSIVGRNLSDKTTTNFCNDAQGAPTIILGGSYFCFVDPPRSISVQATLRY
jgi:outer membrane receptor protein involved in Fe transport